MHSRWLATQLTCNGSVAFRQEECIQRICFAGDGGRRQASDAHPTAFVLDDARRLLATGTTGTGRNCAAGGYRRV